MRVFVTGATGFVGSAVVGELLKAGHEVTGLVHSEGSEKILVQSGAKALRGSLTDLESLRIGASESDGIVHTGFIHDFSKFKECCEVDRKAIELFGEVYAGSNRPLVVTSGLADLGRKGKVSTEADGIVANPVMTPRESEQTALRLAKMGLNTRVVRLAPAVHGTSPRDGFMAGFATVLMGIAKRSGVSAYVGEGKNLWPGVHRLDAGLLFRLALEKGAAGGIYHGVENEGTMFKDIATMIGEKLDLPVVSLSGEEVAKHFSWFTGFANADLSASYKLTEQSLGWKPMQVELLKDLKEAVLPLQDKY